MHRRERQASRLPRPHGCLRGNLTEAKILRVAVEDGRTETLLSLPFDEVGSVATFPDGRRFVATVLPVSIGCVGYRQFRWDRCACESGEDEVTALDGAGGEDRLMSRAVTSRVFSSSHRVFTAAITDVGRRNGNVLGPVPDRQSKIFLALHNRNELQSSLRVLAVRQTRPSSAVSDHPGASPTGTVVISVRSGTRTNAA